MQQLPRVILITGTPGTGKTSLANSLKTRGYTVIHFTEFILNNGLYFGFDHTRDSVIIDELKINELIIDQINLHSDLVFIEGHTTDILDKQFVSKVIVLRCNPGILRKRLKTTRDYSVKKIEENVQAEIMEECLLSVREIYSTSQVLELDSSIDSLEFLTTRIISFINS